MAENKTIKEWTYALDKLRDDPSVNIICPNCKVGKLKIITTYTDNFKKKNEYVVCDNCGITFSATSTIY